MMNTLLTNTPNQILRLTLYESRLYYTTAYSNYLIVLTHEEKSGIGASLSQVLNIVNETERITTLSIDTTNVTMAGRYQYVVYGQNSAVNTDPTNPVVIGVVEIGWVYVTDESTGYVIPTISIDPDIIYDGN
jgi:hypothetical protein